MLYTDGQLLISQREVSCQASQKAPSPSSLTPSFPPTNAFDEHRKVRKQTWH